MVNLDNGKYIIGLDNGYQFSKTAWTLLSNGVHRMGKMEPSVREHSLKYLSAFPSHHYDGKYNIVTPLKYKALTKFVVGYPAI